MNIILLLDWSRINIDRQVARANHRMAEMTSVVGFSNKVVFNFASLGIGEWMTDVPWNRRPKSKDDQNSDLMKLDALRRFHWRVKNEFEKDMTVKANRETREMLVTMKTRGHNLSLVWKEEIDKAISHLVNARSLEYFEIQLNDVLEGKPSAQREGPLTKRIGLAVTDPKSTLVVSDFPEGVEAGKKLKDCVVVGYVPSNQDFDDKGRQLKDLTLAGADYAVIGGYTVSTVPDVLDRKRIMKKMLTRAAHCE